MRVSLKKLIDLPVVTEMGENLGKVIDVNLDVNNNAIVEYVVQSGILKRQKLLIKPAQIVKITAEKMLVEDTLLKNKSTINLRSPLAGSANMLANVSQTVK